ncbi:MAG: alanine--tRNA ligase, partial [Ruminococcus sp.]|nr:alanine--tRNA ligase [Ruminococcus sp.]
RHGKLLCINRTFLSEVAETVIKENANAYPNLVEKHDLIIKVIKAEEENFAKTIDNGLAMLSSIIEGFDKVDTKVLSGADAFKLQDTFGFPIDLTKELLEEKGLTVDIDEFKRLVQENRIRTRNARKDAGAEAWKGTGTATKGLDKTDFKGYETLETVGKISAIIVDGEKAEFAPADKDATLVLDTTSFYGESGGQVGDKGMIETSGAKFEVVATTKTADGVVLHHGHITEGESISIGETATTKVCAETRKSTMRNHTAAHLLQAALRKVLGTHVEQAGQLVDDKLVRFDFVHFSAMTADELKEVEKLVNEEIMAAIPVIVKEMPIDEAKKMGAMALFGEKYGDVVRVVKAGDFSTELCGGTHVDNTGEISMFKIISESSVAAGVRRIEAVTGSNALDFTNGLIDMLEKAASAMKISNFKEIVTKAVNVINEMKAKDKEIEKLSGIIANIRTESMLKNVQEVGDVKLVTAFLEDTTVDELRKMCDLIKSKGDNFVGVVAGIQKAKGTGNICVCCGKQAVSLGAHSGNIAREIAKLAGGSGGGKPDSAMAGAKNVDALPEALSKAADIVKEMVK